MKEFIDKLIERLEEGIFSMDERMKYDSKTQRFLISRNNGIKYAIKVVNELAEKFATDINVVSKDGWIPVSERLPSVGVTVLCYWFKYDRYNNTTNYYYTLMHRNEDCQWISDFGMCTGGVIAWQPLPQPYKKGCE